MKRIMLCSPDMPPEIRTALEDAAGCEAVSVPPCGLLPLPVQGHPDMLFFNFPNSSETVVADSYYKENTHFFNRFPDAHITVDEVELRNSYPHDIAIDALALDENTLVCRAEYTSNAVKRGFSRVVDVKQGYTACSVLRLGKRAAITADSGIYRVMNGEGVNTLLISPGGIELSGYGYGFIGGASTVIGDNVYFFGDLSKHPDGEQIAEFCRVNGYKVVDFSGFELSDLGGVRYLNW